MRQPFALANWKMAMTIAESRAFVSRLLAVADDAVAQVEVVLCPPFTALHATVEAARGSPLAIGGQDLSPHEDPAHTGQVSARLLADAGCYWALLGHWEVRRELGDDDSTVNRKLHRALAAGLRPIVAVGEGRGRRAEAARDLERQLPVILEGASAAEVAGMVVLYEPEWTIGAAEPAPLEHVAAGCRTIRTWLRRRYGEDAGQGARVIYGGSVSPEEAGALLQSPEVDGLGASRRGRDPDSWAAIVRLIAEAKGGVPPPVTAGRMPGSGR